MRLPKEFRLPGKEVRVRRLGCGVLLEPMEQGAEDIRAIFAELAKYRHVPFYHSDSSRWFSGFCRLLGPAG